MMNKALRKKLIQKKSKKLKKKLSNFDGFTSLKNDRDLEELEIKVEESLAFQKVLKKVKQISPKILMNKLKEMRRLKNLQEIPNSEDENDTKNEKAWSFKGKKLKDIIYESNVANWPPQNLCLLSKKLKEDEVELKDGFLKIGDLHTNIGMGDGEAKRRFSSEI